MGRTGKLLLWLCVALVVASVAPTAATARWQPGPEKYGVAEHHNVGVTMADGTVLRADVFYPTDLETGDAAKGPFPVLMVQTPYGKDIAGQASGNEGGGEASTEIRKLPYMIKRGYIDVVVDVRGTGSSHGTFGLLDPIQGRDGAELVQWASKLPHSNGKVGLYGPSYMGYTQLMTAHNVDPDSPLKAIFPIVVGNDTYRDIAFQGGVPGAEFDLVILTLLGALNVGNPVANPEELGELLELEAEHLAGLFSYNLYQGLNILSGGEQAYDGPYWKARRPREWIDEIVDNGIPAFMVGGWYDLFQRGSPLNYSGFQNAYRDRAVWKPMAPLQRPTGRYQLLMGPWYHLDAGTGFSIYPIQLAWFDRWLKGRDTGIEKTRTPLHVFETGADRWVDAKRYPLHRDRRSAEYPRETTYYLDAGPSEVGAPSTNDGTLSRTPPDAEAGADPVAYVGTASPCARQSDQWGGGGIALAFEAGRLPENPCAADDRSIQSGPGALTYTTEPMARDLTLAGPVGATIYATSTRPDVLLVATLEDVYPSGRSRPLTAGALLGSHRKLSRRLSWFAADGNPILPYHPYTKAAVSPVPVGEVTRYDIEVFPTVGRIAEGHSLRLTLTTSDSPHLLPIPEDAAELAGGVYQVQRNAAGASLIEVPMARPSHFWRCEICR